MCLIFYVWLLNVNFQKIRLLKRNMKNVVRYVLLNHWCGRRSDRVRYSNYYEHAISMYISPIHSGRVWEKMHAVV